MSLDDDLSSLDKSLTPISEIIQQTKWSCGNDGSAQSLARMAKKSRSAGSYSNEGKVVGCYWLLDVRMVSNVL